MLPARRRDPRKPHQAEQKQSTVQRNYDEVSEQQAPRIGKIYICWKEPSIHTCEGATDESAKTKR
jgi:hypothetical protein